MIYTVSKLRRIVIYELYYILCCFKFLTRKFSNLFHIHTNILCPEFKYSLRNVAVQLGEKDVKADIKAKNK